MIKPLDLVYIADKYPQVANLVASYDAACDRCEAAEASAAELEQQLAAEQAAHKSDVEALNVRIKALSQANENLASKILMLERKQR